MSDTPQIRYEFDINASVVYQLGEQLISDETQALIELIKNSFDADATKVKITINSRSQVGNCSKYFKDELGFIIIEDNGNGVSVRDKWWWKAGKNGDGIGRKKGRRLGCPFLDQARSSSAMALRIALSSRSCFPSAMPTRSAVVQRRLICLGIPLV